MQHEVDVVGSGCGKFGKGCGLGFRTRLARLPALHTLQPVKHLLHALAVPVLHRGTVKDHAVEIPNDQLVRQAQLRLQVRQVAPLAAMLPVAAELGDEIRIVEQRAPAGNVIVFFRDELAGGGQLFKYRADNAI